MPKSKNPNWYITSENMKLDIVGRNPFVPDNRLKIHTLRFDTSLRVKSPKRTNKGMVHWVPFT